MIESAWVVDHVRVAHQTQTIYTGAVIKGVGASQGCENYRTHRGLRGQVGNDVCPYVEKIAGTMWIVALNAMHYKGLFHCPTKVLIGVCGHITMAA